jgi:hypothetical protein
MCSNFAVNLRQTVMQTSGKSSGKLADMVATKFELVLRQIRGYTSGKLFEKNCGKVCEKDRGKLAVNLKCREKKICRDFAVNSE